MTKNSGRESLDVQQKVIPLGQPDKNFSSSNVKILSGGVLGFVVAAGIAMLVIPRPVSSDYTVKGQSRMKIFYRGGDGAELLPPTGTLRSGEEIRVSFTSGNEGIAYLAHVDQLYRPLMSFDQLIQSGIVVGAGEDAEFPRSAHLAAVKQGETIVVLICSKGSQKTMETKGPESLFTDLSLSLSAKSNLQSFGCQVLSQKLV